MPIDPNIILGLQPPQNNLNQTLQTASGLQGLMANRQAFQANQATSDAFKEATDPTTGQTDYNKLRALIAQGPAAYNLPQINSALATQQNQQQQLNQAKLDMAIKQQKYSQGVIGSLLNDPDVGKADVKGKVAAQLGDAVQKGILPIDHAVQALSSIPTDPAGQAQWLRTAFQNSLEGEAKLRAMAPTQQIINSGASQIGVNIDPVTGKVLGTSFAIQNQLNPAERAQTVEITNPDGSKSLVTKEQFLGMTGGPGGTGYTGRYGQPGPTGVSSGLAPGKQTALVAEAGSSNQAAQALHDAAADSPMRVNLLENARASLSNPDIQTGPGSNWRNDAKSFFNALAPDMAKKIGWTGDVKDYDEFKKIMTNYSSVASAGLGSGTDARLNAAITGNANPNISKMANQDILTKTIAAEKMRAAQDYAFQQSGLTTDQFNKWQSQWNKAVNPDTFVFASMTPDQRSAYIGRLNPQQKTKFTNDLQSMLNAGLIQGDK